MMKKIVLIGGLAMVAAACSSNSGGMPDATVNKKDMPSNVPGKDIGTNFMDTTVKTMRSTLGSSPSSQIWHIPNSTIIVSLTYDSGAKWKGYFQDTGMADGLDLYCNSTAKNNACYSMAPAPGDNADIYGLWDPYMGIDELIPLKAVDKGAGTVTYKSSVADTTVADTVCATPTSAGCTAATAMFGTPVHLTGGPWVVTDLQPALLKNTSPKYMPGTCTAGPGYFGFEVTDMSNGAKLYVMTSFYKTIHFTNDAACMSTGDTVLTTGTGDAGTGDAGTGASTFTTLGGVIDNVNSSSTGATMPIPGLYPFNAADYTLK